MTYDNQSKNEQPASRLLLTERQLAERWQISINTLQNDRVTGKGPPYVKLGGSVRYLHSDINNYEQANRRSSTSATGDHND